WRPASHPAHLPSEQVLSLAAKHGLSIAQLDSCFRHFASIQLDTVGQEAATSTGTAAKNSRPASVAQRITQEWVLERLCCAGVFAALHRHTPASPSPVSFDTYLHAVCAWQRSSIDERLEFVFRVLDLDGDKALSDDDLLMMLQQLLPHQFKTGDRVRVRRSLASHGVLRYIGVPHFSTGGRVWAGIDLDEPTGRHNGLVDGRRYFNTKDKHGVFVELTSLDFEPDYEACHDLLKHLGQPTTSDPSGVTNTLLTADTLGITAKQFCEQLRSEPWVVDLLLTDVLT
ncbi:hypothetical protein BC831DRAFT_446272, partial [Entophlyctis helioformis]